MHENGRYLGLLREQASWKVVEGCTPQEILDELAPRIKYLREAYPGHDWKQALRILGVSDSLPLDDFWIQIEEEEKQSRGKNITTG